MSAITYCSKECQVADWDRHEWNCVPVMVTEFPGKGRGLVASKDIIKLYDHESAPGSGVLRPIRRRWQRTTRGS